MSVIRKAVLSDSAEFAVLVKQFVKEAKYPMDVDMDLVVANFQAIITLDNFFVRVVEEDGMLAGFLVGALNPTLFSRDVVGVELGWYITPPHRKVKMAFKLQKQFESWCKEQKAAFVSMSDIDTLQDLAPMYERMGYTMTEKTYVRKL
jgi:hypothetical protein